MKATTIAQHLARLARMLEKIDDNFVPAAVIGYEIDMDRKVRTPMMIPFAFGEEGYEIAGKCLTDCAVGSAMKEEKREIDI